MSSPKVPSGCSPVAVDIEQRRRNGFHPNSREHWFRPGYDPKREGSRRKTFPGSNKPDLFKWICATNPDAALYVLQNLRLADGRVCRCARRPIPDARVPRSAAPNGIASPRVRGDPVRSERREVGTEMEKLTGELAEVNRRSRDTGADVADAL
jgi:hypothetical protein